jgi:ParB family chromosome partitioning protein
MPEQILEIPLEELFADDDFNSRGPFDATDVYELSKDIREKGLIQPIIIEPWTKTPGKKYRILAGYRRFKAFQVNKEYTKNTEQSTKFDKIPAIERRGLSDIDARFLNLGENLNRRDLNILQEAKAIDKFRMAGLNEYEVARRIGKSRGWVQIRYALLLLPDEFQQEALKGTLSQHQIRDMSTLPSYELQVAFLKKVKDAKLLGRVKNPTAESIKKSFGNQKRPRTREEMFGMIDAILLITNNAHNIGTKCLAWASGEIDDFMFHKYLYEFARSQGKHYNIPDQYRARLKEPITV